MPNLLIDVLRGAVAGAAGTTALNLTTFGDMAVRGRPSSSAPEQLISTVADKAGVGIPGEGETKDNRVSGLAGVSGAATGVLVGAAAGLLRGLGVRLPLAVTAPLIGLAAMAAADVPLATTKVSDPRTWRLQDWLADAVPHLAYGTVTAATLRALAPRL